MKTLLDTARRRFHGDRDHLLLRMMYRHGLRVTEAIDMRLDQLSLQRARLWVRRVKGSLSVSRSRATSCGP
jgi:site-specific recombinase XerD